MRGLSRGACLLVFLDALVCSRSTLSVGPECPHSTGFDRFAETLHLRFLPHAHSPGLFLARFDFEIEANLSPEFRADQFDLFPKSIGKLLNAHQSIVSFEAALTQGRWKDEEWGPPPREFRPPGALLVSAIDSDDSGEVSLAWKYLISALSGSLCASFEGMDPDLGASSSRGRPLGVPWAESGNQLRFATLPYEPVCTENLTPWMKLLPCGDQAGLARLISPIPIAESPLVTLSLSVHVQESKVVLQASLDVVLPLSSAALGFSGWFGADATYVPCPASDSSSVRLWSHDQPTLDLLNTTAPVTVGPLAGSDGYVVAFRMQDFTQLKGSIDVPTKGAQGPAPWSGALSGRQHLSSDRLSVMRDLLSQEGKSERTHGRYLLRFTNPGTGVMRRVLFMDQLPFFIRPLWHTFHATFQGPSGAVEEAAGVAAMQRLELQFVPSDGGKLPTEVFLSVDVPAGGTVNIFMDVLKNFLQLREFSSACEKGFDVGSAAWLEQELPHGTGGSKPQIKTEPPRVSRAAFIASLAQTGSEWRLRFTEGLLVLVPMPDFSMPFNVLALTSTAITFFFGSIFRLTAAGRLPHWVLKKEDVKGSRFKSVFRRLSVVALLGVAYLLAVTSDQAILALREQLPEVIAGHVVDNLMALKPHVAIFAR
mmetsp:Transcript_35558/g.101165  ORF Transcript_35558/g.101165 Transcript_35558/m.101165 type:complete len:651 (+) Transcript_35558:59-2011(+)